MRNSEILLYKLTTDIENTLNKSLTNINIKTDNIKYPDHIFYFNKNKYVAEFNKNRGYFWADISIYQKYNINNNFLKFRNFIHIMIADYLNIVINGGIYNADIYDDVILSTGTTTEIEIHFNKLNYE